MNVRENYICPIEVVTDMLRGKWKTIILWRLRLGPTRLSKLMHDIQHSTEKMLIQQLNELITSGFIVKKVYDGYPLKVEYSLSPVGLELLEALKIIQDVGIRLTNFSCDPQ